MTKHLYVAAIITLLLASCGEDREAMRRDLERLEAYNVADTVMSPYTAEAERLAAWFDGHGTPNERMRAHYILGRTYADGGEAPAAIDAYLKAAECADTTAEDCDYRKLSRVYGQMAGVFFAQNLMDECIGNEDMSIYHAWRSMDTLQALRETAMKAAALSRKNELDAALETSIGTFNRMLEYYGARQAARYVMLPIECLLSRHDYAGAKPLFHTLEAYSGYFDNAQEIETGREAYYYFKGIYFLGMQQYDSAETCFRKELRRGQDFTNQSMASHGLSLLFNATSRPDSAAKYAIYSCEMNDSVYAQMATQEAVRTKASYNYNRSRQIAKKEHERANRQKAKTWLVIIISFIITIIGMTIIIIIFKRGKKTELKLHYKHKQLEHLRMEVSTMRNQLEQLEQLIKVKEESLLEKSEEVDLLRWQKSFLNDIVNEKESELIQLQNEYAKLDRKTKLQTKDSEEQLVESEDYQGLKAKANKGKTLSEEEMQTYCQLTESYFPCFYQFIEKKRYALNNDEYNLCILIRLHINPKAIAALIGKSPSYVTKIGKSTMSTLFKENGDCKVLKNRLRELM